MAIYGLYLQGFEDITPGTDNPDGWTSTRPLAPQVTGLSSLANTGTRSMTANIESGAPAGTLVVRLGRNVTTVNGRSYTITATFTNNLSALVSDIKVGTAAGYGSAQSLNIEGSKATVSYTFTGNGTSQAIYLSAANATHTGTIGTWDDIKVTWSDGTANTTSAPTLTPVADPAEGTVELTFNWTFNDPQKATGDKQTAYELSLSLNGSVVYSTGKVDDFRSTATVYQYPYSVGTWTWKVRTWDLSDSPSSFSAEDTFVVSHTNVAPTLSLAIPEERLGGQDLTVNWTFNSGDPGYTDPPASATFKLYNGSGVQQGATQTLAAMTVGDDLGTGNYPVSLTMPSFTPVSGTNYYYTVQMTDTLGNATTGLQTSPTWTATSRPAKPIAEPQPYMFNVDDAQVFEWTYNPSTHSGAQTRATLYSEDDEGNVEVLANVYGTATSYTVPANTFEAGREYQWYVRTFGQGDPYSGTTGLNDPTTIGTLSDPQVVNLEFNNIAPTVTLITEPFYPADQAATFQWVYEGNNFADPQSEYRLVIKRTSDNTTVYDTGLVASSASWHVVPANTLAPATQYYWNVQVTDTRWQDDVLVPGYFETITPTTPITPSNQFASSGGAAAGTTTNLRPGGDSTAVRLYRPAGGAATATTYTYEWTGLTVGNDYNFKVWTSRPNSSPNGYMNIAGATQTNGSAFITNWTLDAGTAGATYTTYVQRSVVLRATSTTVSISITATVSSAATSSFYWDGLSLIPAPYQQYVPPVYNTTPARTTSANSSVMTNQQPNSPVQTHRTDFLAEIATPLVWTFSDNNAGDTQSAYRVIIRKVSDLSTVVDTGKVVNGTSSYTIPANTLAKGTAYEWQVITWDSWDAQGAPSTWDAFNTAADITVFIDSPAAGTVLDTNSVLLDWNWVASGSDTQAKYRIVVTRTDTNVQVSDTGLVTSTATSATVSSLASDVPYRLDLTIQSAAGVTSDVVSTTVLPDYVNPNEPSAVLSTIGSQVIIVVTNPPATGLRPNVVSNEIWRAPLIGLDAGQYVMIGTTDPNGTYTDYLVGANSRYNYFVRAVS